jgi:hypothetical protein
MDQANLCTKACFDMLQLRLHELQTKCVIRSQATEDVVRVPYYGQENEWQVSGAVDKY